MVWMEQLCAQRHRGDMEITVTHHWSLLAGESEWCLQCKCAVTFTIAQWICMFEIHFTTGIYAFGNSVWTFLRPFQSIHRNSLRWAQESCFIWKSAWGKFSAPPDSSLFLTYELMQPFNLNVRAICWLSLLVILMTKLLAILLDIANRYFLSYCHNYIHTGLQNK